MRKWGYGINGYCKSANIHIEFASWWVFVLGWFGWLICELFIRLPFVGGYFHYYIHSRIEDWCWKHMESTLIDVGYDKLRDCFYERDKKFWYEHEISTSRMIAEEAIEELEIDGEKENTEKE